MIDYIKGKLVYKHSNTAILESNGLGFKLNISLQTFDSLPAIEENVKIFTVLKPKEDEIQLYGFINSAERETFELLTSISGIGPKTALLMLSSVNVNELIRFINDENLVALQKMQGIGKKTAERIVFELKDKVKLLSTANHDFGPSNQSNIMVYESIQALVALGYNKTTAEKAANEAFKDLDKSNVSVENLIKKSLRFAIK